MRVLVATMLTLPAAALLRAGSPTLRRACVRHLPSVRAAATEAASPDASSSTAAAAASGGTSSSGRLSSAGKSLDLRLVAEEPALVQAHLLDRQASEEVRAAALEIGDLFAQRAGLVQEGDAARADRKRLSGEIGKLMKGGGGKEGGEEEKVAALKAQVEEASQIADAADAKLAEVVGALTGWAVLSSCSLL
mmetsp:Transcript_37228/g.83420  ORF Transcript_37228/g.83420 Transcript_37228/m.83420 type:complete len:192 (-) Transcript_37228:53-628(-)